MCMEASRGTGARTEAQVVASWLSVVLRTWIKAGRPLPRGKTNRHVYDLATRAWTGRPTALRDHTTA